MGESSRIVLTSKQTSQILEQIGTGAEARTTSGNSAICETCKGKQIENVANLTTEGSMQEARHKNKTQLKSEDEILEQDTETEAHTSESLTTVAETDAATPGRRAKKGVGMSQNKSEGKTPCEPHGGDGEDCDECNDRRVKTSYDG